MMPLSLPIMSRVSIARYRAAGARTRQAFLLLLPQAGEKAGSACGTSSQDRRARRSLRSDLDLEYRAAAMMRVAHRDRQRVGGVLGLRRGLRQQHADHHADLRLLAVAGADDGLL